MITDKEIGRQPAECDASFFLKVVTLVNIEDDRKRKKYMVKRLKELEKSTIEKNTSIFSFPDSSKVKMVIEVEMDEENDEVTNVVRLNLIEKEDA